MAGPRAPIGSISDHLPVARKIRGWFGGGTPRKDAEPASFKRNGYDDDDDESDAKVSDSESASDADLEDTGNFLRRLTQKPKSSVQTTDIPKAQSPDLGTQMGGFSSKPVLDTESSNRQKPVLEDKKAMASESEPASSPDVKQAARPQTPKGAATNGARPPLADDTTSSEDSDTSSSAGSDSDDESEDDDKEESAKLRGRDLKTVGSLDSDVETSSSDSDAESEDEDEEGARKSVEKTATKISRSPTSTTSSSSNVSSSEGEDEAESAGDINGSLGDSDVAEEGNKDSDVEMADLSLALAARDDDSDALPDAPQVPELILPDFHLRRADKERDAADVVKLFDRAKLEGKQLWFLTAPASLPVTVIEKTEIPIERAEKGLPIFSHNKEDYGVSFEDALTARTIKVLIPNKAGDKYAMLDKTVDRTMHVKCVTTTTFSPSANSADVSSRAAITAPKLPRQQPEGLKARFKPFGVTDPRDRLGLAAAAETPTASATKAVEAPKSSKASTKRKHETVEESSSEAIQESNLGAKKAKKAKIAGAKPSPPPNAASSQPRKQTPILPPSINGKSAPKFTPVPPPSILSTAPIPVPASSKKQKAVSKSAGGLSSGSAKRETAVPVPSSKIIKQEQVAPTPSSQAFKHVTAVPVPKYPQRPSAASPPPDSGTRRSSTPASEQGQVQESAPKSAKRGKKKKKERVMDEDAAGEKDGEKEREKDGEKDGEKDAKKKKKKKSKAVETAESSANRAVGHPETPVPIPQPRR